MFKKILAGVFIGLFFILLVLLILNLLGFKFNKNFFDFNKKECIEKEFTTRLGHSGIQGCIFWMRHDDLQKKGINAIQERWDYLVSDTKDGFYDYCVEQICPSPKLFK